MAGACMCKHQAVAQKLARCDIVWWYIQTPFFCEFSSETAGLIGSPVVPRFCGRFLRLLRLSASRNPRLGQVIFQNPFQLSSE